MNVLMKKLIKCKKENSILEKNVLRRELLRMFDSEIGYKEPYVIIDELNFSDYFRLYVYRDDYYSYFTEDGLKNYEFMDMILIIFPDLYFIMDDKLKYNVNLLSNILNKKEDLKLIEGKEKVDDQFWEELVLSKPNLFIYAPLKIRSNIKMIILYLKYYYKNKVFDSADFLCVKNDNKIMNILKNEYAKYFIIVDPPIGYTEEDKDNILIEKYESLCYISESIINDYEKLTNLLKELLEILSCDLQIKEELEDIYKTNLKLDGYKKIFS